MQSIMQTNGILVEVWEELKRELGPQLDDLTIERLVIGVFFTAVKLSNGQGGVCATPVKAMPEAVCCSSSAIRMPAAGSIQGQPVKLMVDTILQERDTALKKAMAIAILNALSATCWNKARPSDYIIERDKDPSDIELSPDTKVAVVGALGPLLKRLKKGGITFRILEKDVSTLKADELPFYYPDDKAAEVLPWADVIISTGTTLINDSLEELLKYARPETHFVVVGPTASMLPGPFFRRGVSTMGGVLVTDADMLLDIVGEAGAGYHFYGKCADKIAISPIL